MPRASESSSNETKPTISLWRSGKRSSICKDELMMARSYVTRSREGSRRTGNELLSGGLLRNVVIGVRKLCGNGQELIGAGLEGIANIGVEMRAAPIKHDAHRCFVRHPLF